MTLIIREIQQKDNKEIASIIRSSLIEFGVDKPGTVFTDPTTDQLFELFQQENSVYFIAELNGKMVGGCGLYPTNGLPEGSIELVKLYLTKAARGKRIGFQLMIQCIQKAKELNCSSIYLESLPELSNAIKLYESLGFKKLNEPLGNSGHYACDLWMFLNLMP
ncbi:MAG: GNAT family N-acetyltransferase [Flavobacteriia bacterium]|nr:GNAT family N-acetyltransferase [Flavobacteriia bacterium]